MDVKFLEFSFISTHRALNHTHKILLSDPTHTWKARDKTLIAFYNQTYEVRVD